MRSFRFEDATSVSRSQLNRLLEHDTLSEAEIERLRLRYIQHGDIASRNQLVRNFQKALAKVARQFVLRNPGLEFPELISEANLGLLNAVEAYDPSKGGSFAAFAMRGAWNFIMDYLRKNRDTVTVTHTGKEKGHEAYAISIDEVPMLDDDESSAEERLSLLGIYDPSDEVNKLPTIDETLSAYGSVLTEREREILRMRADEATFETIGKKFGFSISRAEQILQSAVKKVRGTVAQTGVL